MTDEPLKEKTAKGLFWGGLSNSAQQLLNLLFGIFLARILSPEEYGIVGMLTIFSLIASSLQESGFVAAIANLKKAEHRDYNAVFWFSTGLSTLLYAILFFSAPLIARFYRTPELVPLSRYVFLGFVFSSLGTASFAYIFRNLMVKQRAISQVAALTVAGCTGVTLACLGFSYWGIATQHLTYVVVLNGCYCYFAGWKPRFRFDFSPLRRMFGFSYKLLITNLFNIVNQNILTVVLGRLYSQRDVGFYNQAYKWNNMGQSAIYGMINGVAQPVLVSVTDERERLCRVFRKMLRFAAFVSFPAMLGLGLVSEELITLTITAKWLPCAYLMHLLCIWGAFFPVIGLYQQFIISRGKSSLYMWNIIASGLLVLCAFLLAYPYGVRALVLCYVCINVGWLPVWHITIRKATGLRLWQALLDIAPYACIAGGSIAAAHLFTAGVEGIWLRFFGKIVITAALYLSTLWACRSVILRESLQYLLKMRKKN